MSEKPTLAPGCYGIGLTFRADALECSTCPFAQRCQPVAEANLARLREELGIKVPRRKVIPHNPDKAAGPTAAQLGMSKKAAELKDRMERAGLKIVSSLREGVNPFATKPAFMRVACHLLIGLPGGVDRETLKYAFMRKLNWSEDTATAHVTQVFQVLPALGAATTDNGILQVRRAA